MRANRYRRPPAATTQVELLDDPRQPVTMGHQKPVAVGTPLHDDVTRVEVRDWRWRAAGAACRTASTSVRSSPGYPAGSASRQARISRNGQAMTVEKG